ncbi:MAG: sigma-70 family RNA polymerase sigma factor [Hyphomicrobium sp.]|nr:sigma-70 family RNA polymerase sigma factor [Hyphomicrobium sp.]
MDRKARETEWSDLMRSAIGGDEVAYRRFLSDLSRALRPIVRRGFAGVSAAPSEVEDVVQEVMLAIHLKRHTWDQSKPIGPWIMAIARNKMIDDLRRRGRRGEVPIDGMMDFLEAGGQDDAIQAHDVTRILSRLSGKNREIVQAITLSGFSAREVADKLGMSEVAVRVSLHRSLKALADVYRETN